MDAQICTNPQCRAILPYHICTLCQAPMEPLPGLSLAPIGIDGAARLVHSRTTGYSVLVSVPTGHYPVHVSLRDILNRAQPSLPFLNAVTGLMIMDSLKTAANLIRSKNTGHWTGWILYLLELLQDHTDTTAFQQVLQDIQHDIAANIVEAPVPPEEK